MMINSESIVTGLKAKWLLLLLMIVLMMLKGGGDCYVDLCLAVEFCPFVLLKRYQTFFFCESIEQRNEV